MGRSLRVVMVLGIAGALLAAAGASAAAVDRIILLTGEHLVGELEESDFTLRTPQSIYRVTRATTWRLELNTVVGDLVHLRNGGRLSGLLDQARYAIRVAGDRTVAVHRSEIDAVSLGLESAAVPSRSADVLLLANGDHVLGDVVEWEFDLILDTGLRSFDRDALWRILLDGIDGDTVEFAGGGRLSGIVDQARYTIRTPEGQFLTYARKEVAEVRFRLPERPRAAVPLPAREEPEATTAGAQVAAVPAPAPTPTPPVPPPLRAALRDVYFQFDRWELTPAARGALEELATAMKAFPEFAVLIEGHADERGTPEYNLALGERRAQVAKDYLVNLGVDPGRVNILSYGEERPLDSTHNERAWALNRRAHFVAKTR